MILPRYSEIDLSKGLIKDYPLTEKMFVSYLGGKTLAARILYDELKPGTDPLSPENVLIINTGPLTGTGAPSSSRFNVTTRNVLTGGIASSNCGGMFGVKMRRAGYEGLIIKGKASRPSYIEIVDGEISIKDASQLWGLNTEETQKQFDRRYGALVIGPAGENLVRYACAVSGERVAGRCGVGAVMGAKNLKGLVAYGTRQIPINDRPGFKKYTRQWVDFLRSHPTTGYDIPMYGTAGFVNKCNEGGVLPTRNFQEGSWDKASLISGEHLTKEYLTRNSGCVSCPIRCERRVMINGKEVKGPEYETIGLLGSNICNDDMGLISEWNYHLDLLGMDTISLGGTLAFAMELQERGIEDFGIRFGDFSNILEVIYKIARREGKFSDLADGSKAMSEKYGGQDFAIHSKGLELASYEPRRSVGLGLGYATANRGGCHLNGGYMVFFEHTGAVRVDPVTTKGKPELTILLQNAMEAVSAGGSCLFTTFAMVPAFTAKMDPSGPFLRITGKTLLSSRFILRKIWGQITKLIPFNSMYLFPHSEALSLVTGLKITSGRFIQIGERGFNLERLFNIREGLSGNDDTLPGRLTGVPIDKDNPHTIVKLKEMLPLYYRIRGWNSHGVPKAKKIRNLGIEVKDNGLWGGNVPTSPKEKHSHSSINYTR